MKPKAILFNSSQQMIDTIVPRVYAPRQRARLESLVDLHPGILTPSDLDQRDLADVRFVFTTWGMPELSPAELAKLPALEAVFYAAGSVQSFARPLLAKGIQVISAWAANAVPVAHFSTAQIILATKRTWNHTIALRGEGPSKWTKLPHCGGYGSTIALLSLGMIGRHVAQLLKQFQLNVIAFEPFPKPGVAGELGVELVSLDECFSRADVVSMHMPNLPSTKGMIRGAHFELMQPYATFINTARGGPVNQAEMLAVLAKRPDLTAVIDVTDPEEPPPQGSPYYTLPNLFLTPHLAGSSGNEVARLADYVIDECWRLLAGEELRYRVSLDMLETMA